MEMALYCPDFGYYELEKDTIGRRGDYYTSVSTGELFGEMLAFQFAEWLTAVQSLKSKVQSPGLKPVLKSRSSRGDEALICRKGAVPGQFEPRHLVCYDLGGLGRGKCR